MNNERISRCMFCMIENVLIFYQNKNLNVHNELHNTIRIIWIKIFNKIFYFVSFKSKFQNVNDIDFYFYYNFSIFLNMIFHVFTWYDMILKLLFVINVNLFLTTNEYFDFLTRFQMINNFDNIDVAFIVWINIHIDSIKIET